MGQSEVGVETVSDCPGRASPIHGIQRRKDLLHLRMVEPLAGGAGQIERHFRGGPGPPLTFIIVAYQLGALRQD